MKNIIILLIFLNTMNLLCRSPDTKERKITLYDREGIINIAKQYLGTPYKAGGSTPEGFDCSGFTMYVYKQGGYKLHRTTTGQYQQLRPVKIPRKGDLVFFKTDNNFVGHVGIYIGDLKFIHAPSSGKKVSIDDLQNPYWKKNYIGTRTIFLD